MTPLTFVGDLAYYSLVHSGLAEMGRVLRQAGFVELIYAYVEFFSAVRTRDFSERERQWQR